MGTILIVNAKIVNENSITESDIYIRNGRIESIEKDQSAKKAQKVLDLKGKHVLPGMIDDNVHFREPGLTGKGDLCSESRAAVAGGITTFFDMPDTIPHVLDTRLMQQKIDLASTKSVANYSFYMGASNSNLEVIKALDPNQNCGIKISMGGANDDLLCDKPENLEKIFRHAPTLIAAQCEDMPTIIENEESYRQIYGDEIPIELHPKIRSEQACYKSSSLAVELAKAHHTRLHVLSISTAKEIDLFSNLPLNEKRISAEVCYPYLDFIEDDYAEKGMQLKCEPAIKSEIDRASLFQGLMDGHLDNIASSHAPHLWMEKKGNYFQVASGMPLVQCTMPSLLEHFHDGIFSLEFIAHKTSHAVAELFTIKERGYLREGYWADLVIVDTEKPMIARHEDVLSKCAWTPFSGYEFRSSVYATLVNGQLAYINGQVRPGVLGKQVEFNRNNKE